jgi:hypothetical protein
MKTLEELYEEARQYGTIDIFGHADGTYSCNISFRTISHIELKAQAGHDNTTPAIALQKAIDKAKIIVRDLGKEAERFKQLSNG